MLGKTGWTQRLSSIDPCMHFLQGDGELLEQEKVQMDHQFVNSAIEKHLDFWKGVSAPQKLEAAEQWKCERCNFRAKCWPETFRKVPWQHWDRTEFMFLICLSCDLQNLYGTISKVSELDRNMYIHSFLSLCWHVFFFLSFLEREPRSKWPQNRESDNWDRNYKL